MTEPPSQSDPVGWPDAAGPDAAGWPDSPGLPDAVRLLAAAQDGAFTSSQAYALGLNADEVQRLRRRGALVDLRRGVYASRAGHAASTPEQRYRMLTRAALLALKSPTTLSHQTAALWTGLPVLAPDLRTVHVTRPELPASRLEAGVHHHPGALPESHRFEIDLVSCTTYGRTALDIARGGDFGAGLAAVDSALRLGVSSQDLVDLLDFCRAWPGARAAGRAVVAGDGRSANPGESLSRALLITAGLAPTDLQVEVRDGQGLVGYADVGWLPEMVLGEFDGRGKYGVEAAGAADAVWKEKVREDRLRALGYQVVRWTWADLQRPQRFLQRVRVVRARAQVQGSAA